MPQQPTLLSLVTRAPEARAAFAELVAREPEALSVVASVTDGLVADPTRYAGARWWVGTDPAGAAVAAFMHTPPHPLHIALATEAEARDLAALLASERDVLPGVGGPRGPARAFADEWVARMGVTARVAMEMGRFDLPVPPRLVFEVAGGFRAATGADLGLVDAWHQDFVDAIEGGGRAAPSLAEPAASGRVGLWEVEGRPVSMAYASPANGGVTRISGVWTPPQLRGHGFASAVVAALSTERREAGERCILFTDLANPTSNAIYEAIGYRRIGDSVHIAFSG